MLEKDFYKKVEIVGYLKHIIYGDSVAKYNKTIIKKKNEKSFINITFNDLWNWLIEIGLRPTLKNDKEYIYLKDEFSTISYDSKNDKFLESVPDYIMRHYVNTELIKLKTGSLHSVDVTKNHSMLEYNIETQHMDSINPEDCRYCPIFDSQEDFQFRFNLDYLLIGIFMGDGTFSDKHYPGFSFTYFQKMSRFLKILKKDIIIYPKNKHDCHINYKKFTNILIRENLQYSNSPVRILSENLYSELNSNINSFLNFLMGYYLTDGSYSSNVITISSSNFELLTQVQELLLNIKIFSKIDLDKNNRKYKDKLKGDMYKLKIHTTNETIIKILNFTTRFKDCGNIEAKGTFYGKGTGKTKNITRKINLAKIRNVRAIHIKDKELFHYNDYVYDLSVPKTQNFIANGILVHNTDSIFILIPQDSKEKDISAEEKWKRVEYHAEEINKRIIKYAEEYFLPRCNIPSNENKIYFKSELLMSQGIFLTVKKNYAYRLLMKEGVPANGKTEYTGIPVVKSDAAKLTQNMIRYYVEEIALTNKTVYEKLEMLDEGSNKFKKQFQENLRNIELDDITFPGKWAKKEIVIFGMKLYNAIMEKEIFSPGSAGRYIYCKITNPISLKDKLDINDIKSETITIPYNYDKDLLSRNMKKYGIIFDEKTQWEKLNITTIDRLFETIKKQYTEEVGDDVI